MTAPEPQPLPVLGLMLGDATGIGPEQCARILANRHMSGAGPPQGANCAPSGGNAAAAAASVRGTPLADAARLVVVGDARVLEQGMRDARVSFASRSYASAAAIDWNAPEVPIVDLHDFDPQSVRRGVLSPDSGHAAGQTLAHMIELAKARHIEGIVFAPLNKAALHAGGWRFNDEHQMFAHLTRHTGYFGEMNVLDNLWLSRVTSHVPLRHALDQITSERIEMALTLADATMRGAGFATPRIAVAALNPHGGENGLFGREEIEIIAPAVAAAKERGIACHGPYPADTVFLKAFAGEFDGVLTMYHDQGQIATKLKGFNRGVTVTAGLQTVFTTPAHGTAFDIVGQGIAQTGALEQAIRLCARIAASRRDASTVRREPASATPLPRTESH